MLVSSLADFRASSSVNLELDLAPLSVARRFRGPVEAAEGGSVFVCDSATRVILVVMAPSA